MHEMMILIQQIYEGWISLISPVSALPIFMKFENNLNHFNFHHVSSILQGAILTSQYTTASLSIVPFYLTFLKHLLETENRICRRKTCIPRRRYLNLPHRS